MQICSRFLQLSLLLSLSVASALAASTTMCQIQDATYSGHKVFLLCERQLLYSSADRGKTWQSVNLPSELKYRSMLFLDEKRAFITGDGGTLLASEDGGNTWSKLDVRSTENLLSIYFIGEKGWLVGEGGTILHSADGGRTWTPQKAGGVYGLTSVFFPDAEHGWIVGWVGVVLRTADGGKTWEKVEVSDASWSLNFVYFRDPQNGWIMGMFGQLLRTRDAGKTWQKQESGTISVINSMFFDKTGVGWVAVENDVLISRDQGDSWQAAGLDQWVFLKRFVDFGDQIWVVGTFHIFTSADGGKTWERLPTTPTTQWEESES